MTKTTTMAIVIIEMILIIIDASNFTNAFSFENTYMYFLMRFRPSSLLKYPKMLIKTFKMVSKVESLEDTRFDTWSGGKWSLLKTVLKKASAFSEVLGWMTHENASKKYVFE